MSQRLQVLSTQIPCGGASEEHAVVKEGFFEVVNALAVWAADFDAVETVYVFGSRVRGDDVPESDLDIAIELAEAPSDAAAEAWTNEYGSGMQTLCVPYDVEPHWPNQPRVGDLVHAREWPLVLTCGKIRCLAIPKDARL
jgi:hypothetical protein